MKKFIRAASLMLAVLCLISMLPARSAAYVKDCGAKLCAITFDDGPSKYTPTLLDGLKERGVKATFFVNGINASNYPETLARIADEGHQLANHTYSHKNLNNLSSAAVVSEISRTEDLLRQVSDEETYYIRAPYGNSNSTVKAAADAPIIYWSVDPLDWKYRNATTVYNNIVNAAYDGCIILVHDTHSTSVTGALNAIDELLRQGYEFTTVAELLYRRGITPEAGVVYYDAKNNGINLASADAGPESYDESKITQHWAYPALSYCISNGYLSSDSDGRLLPNHYIKRGEFLTSLGKFCGAAAEAIITPIAAYSDVDPASECAQYIQWASQTGLMVGYGSSFKPDSRLTRQQAAVVIAKYLVSTGKAVMISNAQLAYTDASSISSWARDSVALCTSLNILHGSSGAFHPKAYLTRGETAEILMELSAI